MLAALALTLAHWLVLASIDPSFWMSIPYIGCARRGRHPRGVGIVSAVKASQATSE